MLCIGCRRLASASYLKLRQVGAFAGNTRGLVLSTPPRLAENGEGLPFFDHFHTKKTRKSAAHPKGTARDFASPTVTLVPY